MSDELRGSSGWPAAPGPIRAPEGEARLQALWQRIEECLGAGQHDALLMSAWQASECLLSLLAAEPPVAKRLASRAIEPARRMEDAGLWDEFLDALAAPSVTREGTGASQEPPPLPARQAHACRVLAAYGREALVGSYVGATREAAEHARAELQGLRAWWGERGSRDDPPARASAARASTPPPARQLPDLDEVGWGERGYVLRQRLLQREPPFEDLWVQEHLGDGPASSTYLARRGSPEGPGVVVHMVRPAAERPGWDPMRVERAWKSQLECQETLQGRSCMHVHRASLRDARGYMRFDDVPMRSLLDCIHEAQMGSQQHSIDEVVKWMEGVGRGLGEMEMARAGLVDLHPLHARIDEVNGVRLIDLGRCRPMRYASPWWKVSCIELGEAAARSAESPVPPRRSAAYSMALIFLDLMLPPSYRALGRVFHWDAGIDRYGVLPREKPQLEKPDPGMLEPAFQQRLEQCAARSANCEKMAKDVVVILAGVLDTTPGKASPYQFASDLKRVLAVV